VRWGCAYLVVLAGCSFKATPVAGGADAPPSDDAHAVHDAPVDTGISQIADAYVCSTVGLVCPDQAVRIKTECNGGCWVACQSNTAFTGEAQVAKLCTDWGGRLAPLRDANDQACVAQVVFPSQASWIGFTQADGQSTLTAGWSWDSDGIAPMYTHWDSGQPNDQNGSENGQEQCAYMTTSGGWQDTTCSDSQFYRFSCRHD
jgi:hypothetical protein